MADPKTEPEKPFKSIRQLSIPALAQAGRAYPLLSSRSARENYLDQLEHDRVEAEQVDALAAELVLGPMAAYRNWLAEEKAILDRLRMAQAARIRPNQVARWACTDRQRQRL